jgi:hypothetical protein
MADLTIGETVDQAAHQRTGAAVTLPTSDFTTHGMIVGMTGSGKTGLALVLLEEVLEAGVPCLLIDPKGDLGNLCLVFPDLAPADFRPWINESDAKKAGVTPDEFAAQQAQQWAEGLAGWGVPPARLGALKAAADVTIFTPGSTSGIPVNIVGSLQAPADMSDLETVRDEIEGYVSGLLGLVGIAADPLASREHILLSNLVENAWNQGQAMDLAALVAQVAAPPIRKLGVFEIDTFCPEKDRMALAMRLNALLASPAFAAWSEGPPLDIDQLLRTPEGKPRAAIVSVAHLSDEERQFVVSLVLSKLVTWMRRQSGTTDLRALLYMDEVAGYVPPTAVPPTKKPIMLLMKQARAFGVGVVLATQNPVDVDYKALSNAGTWMIGRLQTERDKARLLDGMTAAAGTVDVNEVSDTISGLGKREFVLRRAGKEHPEVFTTRWAMSYLRGPLTRDQIAALMDPVRDDLLGTPAAPSPAPVTAPVPPPPPPSGLAPGSPLPPPPPPGAVPAAVPSAAPAAPAAPPLATDESEVLPDVAEGIVVRWLDPAAPWASQVGASAFGTRLEAAAVARVHLLYDDDKAALRHTEEYEAVITPLSPHLDPSAILSVDYDDRDLRSEPPAGTVYALPEAPIKNKTFWSGLQRGIVDHLVRTRTVEILVNRKLKLYSRVGETFEDFARRCVEAADAAADKEAATLRGKYQARFDRLQQQITAAGGRMNELAAEYDASKSATKVDTAGGLLSALFGGRSRTREMTRDIQRHEKAAAMAQQKYATQQVKMNDLEQDLAALENQVQEDLLRIDAEWAAAAEAIETLPVPLEKSDVSVSSVALVWVPVQPAG